MTALTILQAGPAMTIQDLGRPGYRALGLTHGGAADPTALHEGAALLGQDPNSAALEMAGSGGQFRADADTRIALTGAQMQVNIDGEPLAWNASHLLPAGATLTIGGARDGAYGYLHVGGGFDVEPVMASRSSHRAAGIGRLLQSGDSLPIGADTGGETSQTLPRDTRFGAERVRIVASMQTDAFDDATRARFTETTFRRDPRANRMGARMDHDGDGFATGGQLTIVSEVITPGDIQITGDGAPFVLMCECQTTGGYPRIGTVIPCDLPIVAQAQPGAALRFEFVDLDEALAAETRHRETLATLLKRRQPLLRDPARIRDLLAYQLISGVVSATADPFEKDKT
ncbi:biotin-dependent carboxyltransferase [Sulfitobacter sp. S0837]|uniref:5-oxoprolinase subunit C family protein n=1 Tax=Sulfitobacter maritimus TaxID=2741719 RepID=UPI00158171D4|nr:biotin-dependent carboxyltransferase family protein [Sulfitobacter maritimus]NUH67104.1 biotin-dependent carboxyltransferase [Sulfitobacter maritimus]